MANNNNVRPDGTEGESINAKAAQPGQAGARPELGGVIDTTRAHLVRGANTSANAIPADSREVKPADLVMSWSEGLSRFIDKADRGYAALANQIHATLQSATLADLRAMELALETSEVPVSNRYPLLGWIQTQITVRKDQAGGTSSWSRGK